VIDQGDALPSHGVVVPIGGAMASDHARLDGLDSPKPMRVSDMRWRRVIVRVAQSKVAVRPRREGPISKRPRVRGPRPARADRGITLPDRKRWQALVAGRRWRGADPVRA